MTYHDGLLMMGSLISLFAAVGQGMKWAIYHEISLLLVGLVFSGLFMVGVSFCVFGEPHES